MSRTTPTAFSIVLIAGAITLAACGSSGSNTGASGYGATKPTVTTHTASKPASATMSGTASVKVAHSAKLGDYLVDAQGRTLYLFEADHGLTSACTGSCVSTWPAATASKASPGKGIDAAKLTTTKGEAPNQLAYAGHLLYRFSGDTAAGDINGAGIPEWYAINPAGTSIDTH